MNIIKAIKDPNLFRPFLEDKDGSLETWRPWFTALKVLYGLPVNSKYSRKLIRQCTGRNPDKLPKDGFQTALFLTGRRSGKSRMAAVIGAHSAALAGLESNMAAGEHGMVPIVSPSKRQSHVVKDYLKGIFHSSPMLMQEIATDRKWEGFTLKNGTQIEMLAGDFRHVRGHTLVACVIEEICFFGLDEDSRVRSDTELVRALQPALATTNGRLICISSPYAKKGWVWKQYQKHWANNKSEVLVWNAPSRVMNPTLKQSVIDKALREDYAAAMSEYMGQFRDDIGIFIAPELIESLVVKHRTENMPEAGCKYSAFVDLSGGRHDGSALSIAHKDGRKIIVDLARCWRSPLLNPYQVVGEMCDLLHKWGINRVTGDNYAGDFAKAAFQNHKISYEKCEKNKSALYSELLPVLCSGEIELLDNKQLIKELCGLERRTRSGGKDIVDHPQGVGCHDDVANSCAGVSVSVSVKRHRSGGLF